MARKQATHFARIAHIDLDGKVLRVPWCEHSSITDFLAIQELARLPKVELRISVDGHRRRLHAKAWLR